MATSQANLMQTAVNGAVNLVSGYLQAGIISTIDEARSVFETERESIFQTLTSVPTDAPVAAAPVRSAAPAGGASRGKVFTAEEARAIDLRFGKFKGVTLGEIELMDAAMCEQYGYVGKDGEPRTGLSYIKYLANNQDPKAGFTQRAATAILEARRAEAA